MLNFNNKLNKIKLNNIRLTTVLLAGHLKMFYMKLVISIHTLMIASSWIVATAVLGQYDIKPFCIMVISHLMWPG